MAEWLYHLATGMEPVFMLSAQGYALVPGRAPTGGLAFGVVLLLGNALNSFMEEAVFRGVLLTHMGRTTTPARANLLQAALFGVWHVVWPLRDFLDDAMGASAALGIAAGYTALSFLMGLALGWLCQATGSLWAPWAAHTINNSAHNMLHVATSAGIPGTLGLRVAVETVVVAALPAFVMKRWAAARQGSPDELRQLRPSHRGQSR